MKFDVQVKLKGYFILVKHQADENGEVIPGTAEHVAEFDNLITNTGQDMIGNGYMYAYCCVGTGSTTPAITNTTLANFLTANCGQTVSASSYNAGPPEYGQYLLTWRFAAGVAAGNLSEIGVSYGSSGTAAALLFSRALILDGTGTPTTITILPTEVLDCTYVLRIIPPAADVTSNATVVFSGNTPVTYNYTCRPAQTGTWQNIIATGFYYTGNPGVQAYDGVLGARSAQPTGNASSASAAANAYSNGTFTRSCVASFALGSANFANGITAFYLNAIGQWQFGINGGANIPKNSNQVASFTFNYSWVRA